MHKLGIEFIRLIRQVEFKYILKISIELLKLATVNYAILIL